MTCKNRKYTKISCKKLLFVLIFMLIASCGYHELHDHTSEPSEPRRCYYSYELRCMACEYWYRDALILNCKKGD
jgi:hypothetical protein